MQTYMIQATPRKPKYQGEKYFYTRVTGRHDLTPKMDLGHRFDTFGECHQELVRLQGSLSFSDCTLSVLR